MIQPGADHIQETTLILLILALISASQLARYRWRLEWGFYIPVLAVFVHMVVFYVCILFFPWEYFQFSSWSRWLRLHEVGTALLIIVALLIRRKIYHRHAGGIYGR